MRYWLALLLLYALPAQAADLTVPPGYTATATWSAVTHDIYGNPLPGSVTYKFYNIKNGVTGYNGSTSATSWRWAVNVTQCIYVTSVVYSAGKPVESKPSQQFCIAVGIP